MELKLNPKDVYDCLLICSEAFKTGVHPLSKKTLDQTYAGLCMVFEDTMYDYFNAERGDAFDALCKLLTRIYGSAIDPFNSLGASYVDSPLNYEVRARESLRIAEYVKTNYLKD